jgi:hypothetical protein
VMLSKEIGKARMLLGVVESSALAELSGLISELPFSVKCSSFSDKFPIGSRDAEGSCSKSKQTSQGVLARKS